jgi:hypothetical protein
VHHVAHLHDVAYGVRIGHLLLAFAQPAPHHRDLIALRRHDAQAEALQSARAPCDAAHPAMMTACA